MTSISGPHLPGAGVRAVTSVSGPHLPSAGVRAVTSVSGPHHPSTGVRAMTSMPDLHGAGVKPGALRTLGKHSTKRSCISSCSTASTKAKLPPQDRAQGQRIGSKAAECKGSCRCPLCTVRKEDESDVRYGLGTREEMQLGQGDTAGITTPARLQAQLAGDSHHLSPAPFLPSFSYFFHYFSACNSCVHVHACV